MHILKRSWLYVTRKKSKSITIGVLLFVVGTLVLTGFLIQNAADRTYEVAKEKLGANIIYKANTSSIMEEAMSSSTEGSRPDFSSIELPDDYTDLTTKEVETIASNSKYVKSYSYNLSFSANASDFDYLDLNSSTSDLTSDSTSDTSTDQPTRMEMPSMTVQDSDEESDITDVGEIVSGSYFTDAQLENGEFVVIIEQTIADLNDLEVGDTITVEKVDRKMGSDSSDSTEITYTIVGIYETNNPTDVTSNTFMQSSSLPENTLYVPTNSIFEINYIGMTDDEETAARKDYEENGYPIENATFVLNDADNSDLFIAEVKKMTNIDMTYRSLDINDAAYQAMVGNIESVASTANVLVIVVAIAGIAILMLLSILSLKDRKYEMGVLLSLGESKKKVMFQLISETVVIAIISFGIAVGVCTFFSQTMTNYLLQQEASTVNSDSESDTRGPGNGPGGGFKAFTQITADTSGLDIETVKDLTVSLDALSILKTFGFGLIIIILGNVLQAVFVFRLNPKEIMLDR